MYINYYFSFWKCQKRYRHFKLNVFTVLQIESSYSYNYYKLGVFPPHNLSRSIEEKTAWFYKDMGCHVVYISAYFLVSCSCVTHRIYHWTQNSCVLIWPSSLPTILEKCCEAKDVLILTWRVVSKSWRVHP